MSESVYKVVDSRGRVHLPKEFRGKMDLDCGEIVKLTAGKDGLQVKKVHLIELGDKSPEAVEAFVHAAATAMSREKQMELAARLLELLRKGGNNMKRGSALLLACLMAVGLSTTAFAEEPQTVVNTENGGASISITDITPREEQEDETESSFQTGYYPIAIETAEDAGVRLLVKTFLVPEGTDPQALIEESLTRRGITYQVSDILLRELEGDAQTKPVTKTVTTPAETDDTEELLTLLSPTLEYGEDGYAGTLSLDPSSISAKAADTTSYSYTLGDTREYTAWTATILTTSPNLPRKTV